MTDRQSVTLDVTPLAAKTLKALRDEGIRYLVHEGGTRSSKTQSIAQALLVDAVRRRVEVDVCRESMPVLRRSAMKDTISWMREMGVYSEEAHHKTHDILQLPSGSMLRFYGADSDEKLQGPERDVQWINEANEIGADAFREIRRRTRETIVLDYNPSHGRSHWVDELVVGSGRERVIQSTYRDNPFLPEAQVKDIEADVPVYREADGTEVVDWTLTYDGDGVLIAGDPTQWAVYGLGKRAKSDRIVFPHWTLTDRMPEGLDREAYGLDFGWNHPCVCVRCGWRDVPKEDTNLIWDEVMRDTELRNSELANALEEASVPKDVTLWCDPSEPDRIEYLADEGFNAKAAENEVEAGIRSVKEHRLLLTRTSQQLRNEMEAYQWETDKDGEVLDEVVKANDHGPDAGRYGTYSEVSRPVSFGGGFTQDR